MARELARGRVAGPRARRSTRPCYGEERPTQRQLVAPDAKDLPAVDPVVQREPHADARYARLPDFGARSPCVVLIRNVLSSADRGRGARASASRPPARPCAGGPLLGSPRSVAPSLRADISQSNKRCRDMQSAQPLVGRGSPIRPQTHAAPHCPSESSALALSGDSSPESARDLKTALRRRAPGSRTTCGGRAGGYHSLAGMGWHRQAPRGGGFGHGTHDPKRGT